MRDAPTVAAIAALAALALADIALRRELTLAQMLGAGLLGWMNQTRTPAPPAA